MRMLHFFTRDKRDEITITAEKIARMEFKFETPEYVEYLIRSGKLFENSN